MDGIFWKEKKKNKYINDYSVILVTLFFVL